MARKNRFQDLFMTRFELDITALSLRGWGKGKYLHEGQWVDVEVRGGLPGDRVEVEARRSENGIVIGELITRLREGYPRTSPRCEHSKRRTDKDTGCGGCSLQEMDLATQLKLKSDILERFLAKASVEAKLLPIIPCQEQWYYRNKMELSFGPDGAGAVGVGMHPCGFKHEIIALKECYLLSELLPELAQKTTAWARELGLEHFVFRKNAGLLRLLTLRQSKRTQQSMIILTTSAESPSQTKRGPLEAREIIDDFSKNVIAKLSQPIDSFYWTVIDAVKGHRTRIDDQLISGSPVLRECMHLPDEAHSLDFEIYPQAFFQPNSLQAERLYQCVLDSAAPYIDAHTPILDLYCGTGTIALAFARYGHPVRGIDIEVQAIDNARANAERNGLGESVHFHAGDTAVVLAELQKEGVDLTDSLVVIDPPRRGLLPTAFRQILALAPQTLVYVSCNPESLAKDLRKFLDNHYEIVSIQPIDMLPQTSQLESVAVLRAANG